MVSARIAHQTYDYPTLENQPESLINEAISLMSIDDSSVKLIRNGEPLFSKKSVHLCSYVDDIDIIGRAKRDVTPAFSIIVRESIKLGRAVNEDKTKYMLSTSRDMRHIGPHITTDHTIDCTPFLSYKVSLQPITLTKFRMLLGVSNDSSLYNSRCSRLHGPPNNY